MPCAHSADDRREPHLLKTAKDVDTFQAGLISVRDAKNKTTAITSPTRPKAAKPKAAPKAKNMVKHKRLRRQEHPAASLQRKRLASGRQRTSKGGRPLTKPSLRTSGMWSKNNGESRDEASIGDHQGYPVLRRVPAEQERFDPWPWRRSRAVLQGQVSKASK